MHTQYMLDFPWKRITQAWPQLSCAVAAPLAGGLINRTLRMSARDGRDYVLQWLNPVFPATVSADVAAVTRHMKKNGLPAFSVVPTSGGEEYLAHDVGSFRLLTFLEGRFLTPGETGAAGAALADFHRAMADFTHAFSHDRNIHRPREHARRLREVLESHRGHRLHEEVRQLATPALEHLESQPEWDCLPTRIVHGDPKLENFWRTPGGVTLLDLDTVGRHCMLGELGDAGRSMCREGDTFSMPVFEEFFSSYLGGMPGLTQEEILRIPESIETIAWELTARFLADALEECYFAWDSSAFPGRGEHNLERARREAAFARSAAAKRRDCEKLVQSWI